jgi:hypothetical protein
MPVAYRLNTMRLAEMTAPRFMMMPGQAAMRRGAWTSQLGAPAGPVYLDLNGNPINSIICGGSYTFDVPGYSAVWLIIKKNDVQVFSAQFPVPMATYQSTCADNVGYYLVSAYDLQTGQLIGTTQLTILPASAGTPSAATTSPSGSPPPAPGAIPSPGIPTGTPAGTIFGMSPTTLLIAGAAAFFLLGGKK